MAGQPGSSADRASRRQPLLADGVWDGAGEDCRGFWNTGRAAVASRTAGLACDRIYPYRLGYKGDDAPARHLRGLSTIFQGDASDAGEGSGEPSAGARAALSA